jgi:hypothetical protein
MFAKTYKPETIARIKAERIAELVARRAAFVANVALASAQYPQFAWPELPESNVLYLEAGEAGPKGFRQAISVSASQIKFEQAF